MERSRKMDKIQSEICLDILNKYNYDSSKLVTILLEIQEKVNGRFISQEMAHYISVQLDLPLSRVFDVLSFYSALHDHPRAKIHIQVCDSVVCRVNHSNELMNWLVSILGAKVQEVNEEDHISIERVACFGACDRSPAVRINGVVYGPINSEQALLSILEEVQCG